MLGRTLLGLLETQAHAGRRAALGTIRRTATWRTPTPVSHLHHRSRAIDLAYPRCLGCLGLPVDLRGLVVRAHPWGLGPTRRWRPPVSSRRIVPSDRRGHGMCEKCQELEKKIERYRRIAFSINDPLTIDRLNQLIKDSEAERAKLHPDQQR
jgi:hypothetical protein